MIWIACALLFAILFTLALQALHRARRAGAGDAVWLLPLIRAASYQGPARLELFGHTTHIGWVRQGPERIDVLTIEGEALQCDARSRYRLTPLTWKEFVGECSRRREEKTGRDRADIEDLKYKRGALREAMANASELLCAGDVLPTNPIEQIQQRITDARRILIDGLERDDEIPF